MDFGYKIITLKKGIKLQISLLSDFPGYALPVPPLGENNLIDDVYKCTFIREL